MTIHADLPFDHPGFISALAHVGTPDPRYPFLLRRPIARAREFDVLATLPYSAALSRVDPEALRRHLDDAGAVAFFGVFPPGMEPDTDVWVRAGFEVPEGKVHFIRDPAVPPAHFSARTRRNLSNARRAWRVRRIAPEEAAGFSGELYRLHHDVCMRRQAPSILDHPATVFAATFLVPEFETAVAFDTGTGRIGGFLILACGDGGVHFFAIACGETGYRDGAAYALFNTVLTTWYPEEKVFLGGVPSTGVTEGIRRFKSRFANASRNARPVRILLRPETAGKLTAEGGGSDWFPPYRRPIEPRNGE